ncbi:MAG: hypothetical protein V4480_00590 [Patescibacteria group bacterium]
MQETISPEKPKESFQIQKLSLEERDRLVSFFALLLKVDKRVNPALYQIKKTQND